jgi:hypothetical protein
MIVTLESTTKVVTLNGVQARIWEGATESGIQVHAYITRIATSVPDTSEFERELTACRQPSIEVQALPARMVL